LVEKTKAGSDQAHGKGILKFTFPVTCSNLLANSVGHADWTRT